MTGSALSIPAGGTAGRENRAPKEVEDAGPASWRPRAGVFNSLGARFRQARPIEFVKPVTGLVTL
eukprot:7378995-Pyramimonas_sp.AAC.1